MNRIQDVITVEAVREAVSQHDIKLVQATFDGVSAAGLRCACAASAVAIARGIRMGGAAGYVKPMAEGFGVPERSLWSFIYGFDGSDASGDLEAFEHGRAVATALGVIK